MVNSAGFKLTGRDKRLLYIMFLALSAFLLWRLLIKPLTDVNAELRSLVASSCRKCEELAEKVDALPEIRASCETAGARYAESARRFYPLMEAQDVDAIITGLAVKNNIKIRSFSVVMPGSCSDLSPYRFSETALEWSPGDLAGIYAASISITAAGGDGALNRFIDCICSLSSLRISSLTWSPSAKNGGLNESDRERWLSLNLELYMCGK